MIWNLIIIILVSIYIVGLIMAFGVAVGVCDLEGKKLSILHLFSSLVWPLVWVVVMTVYFIEQCKEQHD